MDIYPIFNVAYLYHYVESEEEKATNEPDVDTIQHNNWQKQIPTTKEL